MACRHAVAVEVSPGITVKPPSNWRRDADAEAKDKAFKQRAGVEPVRVVARFVAPDGVYVELRLRTWCDDAEDCKPIPCKDANEEDCREFNAETFRRQVEVVAVKCCSSEACTEVPATNENHLTKHDCGAPKTSKQDGMKWVRVAEKRKDGSAVVEVAGFNVPTARAGIDVFTIAVIGAPAAVTAHRREIDAFVGSVEVAKRTNAGGE